MTLQELAPYLPHNLRFRTSKHQIVYGEFHVMTMRGLSLDSYGDVNIEFLFNDELYFSNEMMLVYPLLRPLSDLTRPITVDGYNDGKEFISNHHPYFKLFIEADLGYFVDHCPTWTDWAQLSLLLSWHFDVFGLIEKGEAIDINTLP